MGAKHVAPAGENMHISSKYSVFRLFMSIHVSLTDSLQLVAKETK